MADIITACFEYFNNALTVCLDDIISEVGQITRPISKEQNILLNESSKKHLSLYLTRITKYHEYALESMANMFKLYNSKCQIKIAMLTPAIEDLKEYLKNH